MINQKKKQDKRSPLHPTVCKTNKQKQKYAIRSRLIDWLAVDAIYEELNWTMPTLKLDECTLNLQNIISIKRDVI